MRTLLLALAIGIAPLPASAQTVRAGIDAWQKGEAAAAVGIWRPLAEKGDADAAFNLGQAYRLGKGVPLDLAQAQSWLERAARKGHVDAAAKRGLAEEVLAGRGLGPESMVAIGDGANDVPLVELAGLGVGYRPKPALAQVADGIIRHHDLTALLWMQGIPRSEWQA